MVLVLETGCNDEEDPPSISSVSPNTFLHGQQNVQATVTGDHLIAENGGEPFIVADEDNDEGVTATLVSANYSTQIVVSFSITNTADVGQHSFTVSTKGGEGRGYFNVACNPPSSCPLIPDLTTVPVAVLIQGGSSFLTFFGHNFFNQAPVLEFERSGITVPVGGFNDVEQLPDGIDQFSIVVNVDPHATTGNHRVRIRTNGGRTDWTNLFVEDEFVSSSPPAGVPTLDSVTPTIVGPDTDVVIECHGKGFGAHRKVITTPDVSVGDTLDVVNSEADADSVAVVKIHPTATGYIKVQVQNLDNNLITDDIRVFVDPQDPSKPVGKNNATDGVHRGGGAYTLQITGSNLSSVSDTSWSGVPGLHFSHTYATPTTASVTVTADAANAQTPPPLTGNAATNVTVNIGPHLDSFPFPINILP